MNEHNILSLDLVVLNHLLHPETIFSLKILEKRKFLLYFFMSALLYYISLYEIPTTKIM